VVLRSQAFNKRPWALLIYVRIVLGLMVMDQLVGKLEMALFTLYISPEKVANNQIYTFGLLSYFILMDKFRYPRNEVSLTADFLSALNTKCTS
jgi:chromosome condensin MukBEF MukE localization factor